MLPPPKLQPPFCPAYCLNTLQRTHLISCFQGLPREGALKICLCTAWKSTVWFNLLKNTHNVSFPKQFVIYTHLPAQAHIEPIFKLSVAASCVTKDCLRTKGQKPGCSAQCRTGTVFFFSQPHSTASGTELKPTYPWTSNKVNHRCYFWHVHHKSVS